MFRTNCFKDKKTGVLVHEVGYDGLNTTQMYFTAMTWQYDNCHLILAVGDDKKGIPYQCYSYDTVSGESVPLEGVFGFANSTVASDHKLYYFRHDSILSIDLKTGERSLICTNEQGAMFKGPLSVSNDGKVLGALWNIENDWYVGKVDIESGGLKTIVRPKFDEPYSLVSHVMVNPVYTNLIFYCHEGKTEHIPDRIWVADENSGRCENIYRQKRTEDGLQGECVGHEMWSYDGERLYFVKYIKSVLNPAGIYYVDKLGACWGLVNSEFPHWHVAASPDGRWVVSDTIADDTGTSKIVLMDVKTGHAEVLCEVKCWSPHPGHPHPSFSPDSRKVSFNYSGEDGYMRIGIIEV